MPGKIRPLFQKKTTCKKCGTEAEHFTTYIGPLHDEGEHFKRFCVHCGYDWKEAMKDALKI